jgi:hypothetical protein
MSGFARSSRIQPLAAGALAGVLFLLPCAYAAAQDQSVELRIVAGRIRSQGYVCKNPSSVERVEAESMPNEPVYVLTCDGISYRVRLVPDQAAEVSEIR